MKTLDIYEELRSNSYPGRGIIIGKSADGKNAVTAYFIMGRSVNSRNRYLPKLMTVSEPKRQTPLSLPTRTLSYTPLYVYWAIKR